MKQQQISSTTADKLHKVYKSFLSLKTSMSCSRDKVNKTLVLDKSNCAVNELASPVAHRRPPGNENV